jgi:hypothetical protein
VRVTPRGDAGTSAEPPKQLLDPGHGQALAALAEQQRAVVVELGSLVEVAPDRPPSGGADRHDPLFGTLAHDLDRAVGPEIGERDPGDLRDAQPGVDQEQQDGCVASVGHGEEPPKVVVGERLLDHARHPRPGEGPQRPRLGKPVAQQPVAEGSESPDVAGDADGGKRRPELEEPSSELGRTERVDRQVGAEASAQPIQNHSVPDDRARAQPLGLLRGAEEVGRPPEGDHLITDQLSSVSGRPRSGTPDRQRIRCSAGR